MAKYVLHYYDNYFGIPYPLKKLDLIALPDFEAGAMENFGAITYRETDLLLDPKTASVDCQEGTSPSSSRTRWPTSGSATWSPCSGGTTSGSTKASPPGWKTSPSPPCIPSGTWTRSSPRTKTGTLNLDAQPTTRAIRAKADTPDEINQMFDGISYGKASDVLLTVENYLGDETFRKGVHAYLAAHLYANATAEDFWNAQTAVSHKPVDKIMDSLIAQRGEPLLTSASPPTEASRLRSGASS